VGTKNDGKIGGAGLKDWGGCTTKGQPPQIKNGTKKTPADESYCVRRSSNHRQPQRSVGGPREVGWER